ncbi:GtrA family protein [Salinicola sp. LHM]|jgi:putative flippase GtrA|uniref:GtrA family protein n=1 Tax=Salinicola TaxID=404432 RepID=UPI000DA1901C|nr:MULTISPECIES: GtrA family protein [Salinicola]MED5499453.1 GtrA family protein [Pseudomonadota bacterium]WQH31999.1 GtrA family protein [Salinicola sp. LHM]
MKRRLKREAKTAARFGLVGTVATAAHLSVAAVLSALWPTLSEFIVNLCGFLVAFQISLVGHRRLTFRRRGRAKRFFTLAVLGFVLNNGVLAALLASTRIAGFWAIVIATLTVPLITYVGSRLWAFREHHV